VVDEAAMLDTKVTGELLAVARQSAQLFVARETAHAAAQLARQMARGEVRAASLAWATSEELARTRTGHQAETSEAQPSGARDEDSLRAKVRDALAARHGSNVLDNRPATPAAPDERTNPGAECPIEPAKA